MKAPDLAWIAALLLLAIYEIYALATNQITLSRAVWTLDMSAYGMLLPVMGGGLAAHFFATDVQTILAFLFGFVGAGLFWHKVG